MRLRPRVSSRVRMKPRRDCDLHLVAAAQLERRRVVRMHEADGVRERAVELRHAPRHRAGVPMLEHAAGDQPVGDTPSSGDSAGGS